MITGCPPPVNSGASQDSRPPTSTLTYLFAVPRSNSNKWIGTIAAFASRPNNTKKEKEQKKLEAGNAAKKTSTRTVSAAAGCEGGGSYAATALKVGDSIEARYGGGKGWFPGKISGVQEDGQGEESGQDEAKYDIAYADGDTESGVHRYRIRLAGETQPASPLPVGARVDAYAGGGKKLYPGHVVGMDIDSAGGTTYSIKYDDGDEETEVDRQLIVGLCNSASESQGTEKRLDLWSAAKAGSLDEVRSLVAQSSEFDEQDNFQNVPLYYAAHAGHLEVVDFFLKKYGGPENVAPKLLDRCMCNALNEHTRALLRGISLSEVVQKKKQQQELESNHVPPDGENLQGVSQLFDERDNL